MKKTKMICTAVVVLAMIAGCQGGGGTPAELDETGMSRKLAERDRFSLEKYPPLMSAADFRTKTIPRS